jgi:hypothetical protein
VTGAVVTANRIKNSGTLDIISDAGSTGIQVGQNIFATSQL